MAWSLNKVVLYVVCMYWTHLVPVWPAASLYSAIPLKHHATGMQWCPNPDHYPDSKPASRSLTPLCWALSRAAELQILTSFVWHGRGWNHQTPACQANAKLLHYPAAVGILWNSRSAGEVYDVVYSCDCMLQLEAICNSEYWTRVCVNFHVITGKSAEDLLLIIWGSSNSYLWNAC